MAKAEPLSIKTEPPLSTKAEPLSPLSPLSLARSGRSGPDPLSPRRSSLLADDPLSPRRAGALLGPWRASLSQSELALPLSPEPEPKATTRATLLSVVAALSYGFISMPYAFVLCGSAPVALGLLGAVALSVFLATLLAVRALARAGAEDWPACTRQAFGSCSGELLGGVVALEIWSAVLITVVATSLQAAASTPVPYAVWAGVVCGLAVLLAARPEWAARLAKLGVAAVALSVACFVGDTLSRPPSPENPPSYVPPLPASAERLGQAAGIMLFAFGDAPVLLPVYARMREPKRFAPVLACGLVACCSLYALTGLVALAYFGAAIEASFLLSILDPRLALLADWTANARNLAMIPLMLEVVVYPWLRCQAACGVPTAAVHAAVMLLTFAAAAAGQGLLAELQAYTGMYLTVVTVVVCPVLTYLKLCVDAWRAPVSPGRDAPQ